MNKNKLKMFVLIIGTITILSVTIVRIIKIENNYQVNKLKLEVCKNGGGTAVIKEKNFLGLTSVTCKGRITY